MNKKEAIDAIKCNYPPEHYSILREALDMAIKELEVTSKEALEAAEVIRLTTQMLLTIIVKK